MSLEENYKRVRRDLHKQIPEEDGSFDVIGMF